MLPGRRGRRDARGEAPVSLEEAASALALAHPTLDAGTVTTLVHHSRDLLAAIDPAHERLQQRAVDLAAARLDALDASVAPGVPRVLFLSTRNDGMSIIAEALVRASGAEVLASSAGVRPVAAVLRSVTDALAEVGVDHPGFPKPLTSEVLARADVVVTMLCDAPPLHDGQRTEAWDLADPAGLGSSAVRSLRDDIRVRVDDLLARLA
ncbi:arsenate-mycothiol transferase ArsC [Agrococcus sp. SGAir0287]|uniref:arsenate-mycothiol transferase ArsC n=1 Tax=Agrococcus sp. SGAir0287 TaxID=2070347 RepID=UPI0010CD50D1|nr:arsenate reductase ArsC [Agrococcus sp. SGAir0287]QCR19726.1 phosphatase [Agrococcus sp. SGAir0287]